MFYYLPPLHHLERKTFKSAAFLFQNLPCSKFISKLKGVTIALYKYKLSLMRFVGYDQIGTGMTQKRDRKRQKMQTFQDLKVFVQLIQTLDKLRGSE